MKIRVKLFLLLLPFLESKLAGMSGEFRVGTQDSTSRTTIDRSIAVRFRNLPSALNDRQKLIELAKMLAIQTTQSDYELDKAVRSELVKRTAKIMGVGQTSNLFSLMSNADLLDAIDREESNQFYLDLVKKDDAARDTREKKFFAPAPASPNDVLARKNYRAKLVQEAEFLGISTNRNNKDLKAAIREAKKQKAIEEEHERLNYSTPAPKSKIKLFFGEVPEMSEREKRESLEGQAEFLGIHPCGTNDEIQSAINDARKKKERERVEEEAKGLGLATYGTVKELNKRIDDFRANQARERAAQERTTLEEEALRLGIRVVASSKELRKAIQERKTIIQKQEEAEQLERRQLEVQRHKWELGLQTHTFSREYQRELEKRRAEIKAQQKSIDDFNAHRMSMGEHRIGTKEDIARAKQTPYMYDDVQKKFVPRIIP